MGILIAVCPIGKTGARSELGMTWMRFNLRSSRHRSQLSPLMLPFDDEEGLYDNSHNSPIFA